MNCFELRTYTVRDGGLPELHQLFQGTAAALFQQYDMMVVAYWIHQDRQNTLSYLLAHPSRDAAVARWRAFRADPAWQAVKQARRGNEPLVTAVEEVFLIPTDYSPLR